jgi:hypothetical protein
VENIPTRQHNEFIESFIEPILCMSDLLLQRLLRRSASSLLVFIGCFLMLASAAYSQSALSPLWRILETPSAQMPALPAYATQAVPVTMDAGVLAALQTGVAVPVPVQQLAGATQFASLQIHTDTPLLNGDRTLRGELTGYAQQTPFVLTASQLDVFAYAEIGTQVWQLHVSRPEAAGDFQGWIYQSEGLREASLQQDYVIPERASPGAVALPVLPVKTLPLRLGNGQEEGTGSAARIAGINAGNLQITQLAGTGSVLAGGNAEILATFRNTSAERHEALSVNFYFVLENSTLVSAASGCRQGSVGTQKVLNCPLGDFAAGEVKTLRYTIATTPASRPRVISTAVVGELRHDAVLNVVEDVVRDSDNDGISDFNESLLGTNPAAASSVSSEQSVIDVMALYTPGADALYGGAAQTRINQLIAMANQIYADSGVSITLRPVYMASVGYSEKTDMDSALSALTSRKDPAFAQVDSLREQYGADLVMLFRPQGTELDRCGLANLGGFRTQGDFQSSDEKQFAFSTMAIDCPVSSVVAHELGHNMGLTHSHREDGYGGTFPFATGYGVDTLFTTVMAYPGAFNTSTRIARFSSPAHDCLGVPCGVDASDAENGADAVRALNLVRHQIARYYPIRVPLLPDKPLGTLSGGSTNARIALAASLNKGLSQVSVVTPADSVDVNLSLTVDSRHAGKAGAMYVLATLDGSNFVMLDEQGGIQSWDGSFAGLRAFRSVPQLRAVEYVQIVNAARLGKDFVDRRLQIYIAYSVPALGEIVYTVEPLALDISR